MKELSIEEKAKRYDEILARATGAYLPYYTEDIMTKVREFVDYLLPELKESEDERIRKEIINYFEHYPNIIVKRERKIDWIAWLEKQAQKPAFEMKTPEESLNIDSDTYNKIVDECVYELEEQKPAWSEEDSVMYNRLLSFAESEFGCEYDLVKWLKSFKGRVGWEIN